MSYLQENTKPVTLFELGKMRAEGRKIVMLTGYDASFAALLERCGVDVILVGDSLGNVLQGQKTTLPVTVEQMLAVFKRNNERVKELILGMIAALPDQGDCECQRALATARIE